MFPSLEDKVAHKPVEVTHQIVGSKPELGLCHGLDGAFLKEQVEERPDKGEGEQREENGDQVEHHVHDDGTPIRLDVGEDAGEGFLLFRHGLFDCDD